MASMIIELKWIFFFAVKIKTDRIIVYFSSSFCCSISLFLSDLLIISIWSNRIKFKRQNNNNSLRKRQKVYFCFRFPPSAAVSHHFRCTIRPFAVRVVCDYCFNIKRTMKADEAACVCVCLCHKVNREERGANKITKMIKQTRFRMFFCFSLACIATATDEAEDCVSGCGCFDVSLLVVSFR